MVEAWQIGVAAIVGTVVVFIGVVADIVRPTNHAKIAKEMQARIGEELQEEKAGAGAGD